MQWPLGPKVYSNHRGTIIPPGCPHSLPHAPPRMPRYFVRELFCLQTPVDRSKRVAGRWAVRAQANQLSLGVWYFTLRFILPRSWVGYPSRRPTGCGMQSPSGPKVYPSVPAGSCPLLWPPAPRSCLCLSCLSCCFRCHASYCMGPKAARGREPWGSTSARPMAALLVYGWWGESRNVTQYSTRENVKT